MVALLGVGIGEKLEGVGARVRRQGRDKRGVGKVKVFQESEL